MFKLAAKVLLVGLGLVTLSSLTYSSKASSQELNLVGNKVETFINDRGQPARLNDLVDKAFTDTEHTITATTQAWSGSGLRNGQFDGYIDHYSLNHLKSDYVYSEPFVGLNLHVASTEADAQNIFRLDELYKERVGLEVRFANTDQVRSQRNVKWARAQDFFNNIEQLAEQRVDYIVADIIMLQEMNKMLSAIDQEPLYISEEPLITLDLRLGIHTRTEGAEAFINEFDAGIALLKSTGQYNEIYLPSESEASTLDKALYEDILKRW